MSTSFSSILRGVNRQENDKLNILTINCDEKFQWMFGKINHNFYFINNPQSPPWNTQVRMKPDNCILLENKDLSEQINDIPIDLIVCQARARDYNILSKLAIHLSVPIISINNFLPFPEHNQFFIQNLADQIYNQQIFCSKFVCNSWGLDEKNCIIIPKSICTETFSGWEGKDNKVLINCDWYQNKKNITGFNLLEKIVKQIPINLRGINQGVSEPFKNLEDQINVYQRASVFLNTSNWLSCPYEVLEAMSIGCPIVTTKTTDVQDIIVNGENGFITNDVEELIKYCKELINNKELASKIGEAGRKTVVEKFGKKIFIEKWNELFYSTIDTPAATLVN